MEINSLPVANFSAHTLHRNMHQKDPPLSLSSLSFSLIACPQGLDWDGASCDIIVGEDDISDDSEGSHWSIMGGRQTLVFMLLASVVVMVTSLAVRARTANRLRSTRDKEKLNSRTFRTPLVNRVEDLVVQPS